MQHGMNANGYRIQRLDHKTDLITTTHGPSVEPFPTKRWNEPLPIAVEGTPVHLNGDKPSEAKPLNRFYPPLLFFSTALTGVFLFLYLTKPVIVQQAPATVVEAAEVVPVSNVLEVVEAPSEELSPWPESELLGSNSLPGLEVEIVPPNFEEETSFLPTTLGVEQIVTVESLDGELEELTVSLPVLYPEDMLSWDDESVLAAEELAADIDAHLTKVREVQANGVRLLESWNHLVSKSVPQTVIAEQKSLGFSE